MLRPSPEDYWNTTIRLRHYLCYNSTLPRWTSWSAPRLAEPLTRAAPCSLNPRNATSSVQTRASVAAPSTRCAGRGAVWASNDTSQFLSDFSDGGYYQMSERTNRRAIAAGLRRTTALNPRLPNSFAATLTSFTPPPGAWFAMRTSREDVTQAAFIALAKNAAQLTDRPVLSGWLHRTAQNIAAQTVRTDVRRRAREQEAAAMNELLAAAPDADWEQIAPHLDAALGELERTRPRRPAAPLFREANPPAKWRRPSASATMPRKNA